jgi:hypothetical protein
MDRRRFIELSAFTALALALPVAQGCNGHPKELAVAQPYLFSHLVDAKTIKEAGADYLKNNGGENDQQKLSQLLLNGKAIDALGKDEIQTLLNEHVAADFKTGKVLQVSGWVMSLTEARQCALYSLINA